MKAPVEKWGAILSSIGAALSYLLLLVLLYVTSQSRLLPLIFAGIMLALVLFQHFGVLPELTARRSWQAKGCSGSGNSRGCSSASAFPTD